MKRRPSRKKDNKRQSRKVVTAEVWSDNVNWKVVEGILKRAPGKPGKIERLFRYVGEKLPFGCLLEVRDKILQDQGEVAGIYLAHDSMGVARYGGRGRIFGRLQSRRRKNPRELLYFSFYVIKSKNHERELETVILRAAGPQMILNRRKVRSDIDPGNIRDYEPGTQFFARQQRKGKKKKKRKKHPR